MRFDDFKDGRINEGEKTAGVTAILTRSCEIFKQSPRFTLDQFQFRHLLLVSAVATLTPLDLFHGSTPPSPGHGEDAKP